MAKQETAGDTWVIKPATTAHIGAMLDLAEELGPGMTTLPSDRNAIAGKLERSQASFAGRECSEFLLAMIDRGSGTLLGCAGVYPNVGEPYGFFSYRHARQLRHCSELGVSRWTDTLHPTNDYTGSTEVGTLAVRSSARGFGVGRLLAKSRYLLVAAFPELFGSRIMAEMRGWQNGAGRSPFWDAVGERFFGMDFEAADRLSAIGGSKFISDLLPQVPLCMNFLPQDARAVVGRPHPSSAFAMKMLLEEGFRYEGLVDVFDAGPQVAIERTQIATVRSSRELAVSAGHPQAAEACLVATTTLASFQVNQAFSDPSAETCVLPEETRRRHDLDVGIRVLVSPLESRQAGNRQRLVPSASVQHTNSSAQT